MPSSPGTLGQGFNHVTQEGQDAPNRNDLVRLDWSPNNNWRVYGKLLQSIGTRVAPYGGGTTGFSTNIPEFGSRDDQRDNRGVSMTAAVTLNNTTFLEMTFGTSRNEFNNVPLSDDFTKANLGLSAFPMLYPGAVQLDLPPRFNYAGRIGTFSPTNSTEYGPFLNKNPTKDLAGSLTKTFGPHTVKAGAYFTHGFKPQSHRAPAAYGAAYLPQNQDPTLAASAVPGATALPVDFLRPYQGYGNIFMVDTSAYANYNSLQTSLSRRFRNGVLFSFNYTLSKAMGLADVDLPAGNNNPNPNVVGFPRNDDKQDEANYYPLGYDRRHNVVSQFVWELPKLQRGGVLSAIVNNWQMSGVYRWVSGTPYTPTSASRASRPTRSPARRASRAPASSSPAIPAAATAAIPTSSST